MSKLLDIKPKIKCEHESNHANYDASLIRKCSKCDLFECVKCFSLLAREEL